MKWLKKIDIYSNQSETIKTNEQFKLATECSQDTTKLRLNSCPQLFTKNVWEMKTIAPVKAGWKKFKTSGQFTKASYLCK